MIEVPHILIRCGPGARIRVLRLVADGRRIYPLRYHAWRGPGCCRSCGCTDQHACLGGCGWAEGRRDLCSRCYERIWR